MRKKTINILLLLLISTCTHAQTQGYKYSATLDTVSTAGFYNIALSPMLTAHLKTDLSDIRVINEEGKWVPHVVRIPGGRANKRSAATEFTI